MTREASIQERDQVTRTVCPMIVCLGNHCSVKARVRDGRLVRIEPIERGRICGRGLAWPERVYDPKRPLYPMRRIGERGEGRFERISWDEALAVIAEKVNAARAKYGSRSIGFIGAGGGAAGGSRLATLLEGTVISSLGAIGDSPVGTARVTGMSPARGTCLAPGGNDMEDTEENSKLMVIWGNNVAETEQRQMRYFLRAKERGAKLVVVDPVYNVTASKADQWIPVRVGTDAALILSMIWVIHTEEMGDLEFMKNYTQSPFLVRKDDGRFLRESDIAAGGSPDKFVIWDSVSGSPRAADAPGVNPSLMGSYSVAGVEAAPTYQVLIDEARQYTPEAAAEITGVNADTIRQLAI
ncbi:MAG: molybdopterin-dependent oxidoreductase, partial [Chloroflexi bacterium]|nr:molybdopterin-dependent oxidoreductase [Chloroflexota bacterium]